MGLSAPNEIDTSDLLRRCRPWGFDGRADVRVRDGVIERIEPGILVDEQTEVLDVSGRLVLPGRVDAHCHLDKTPYGGRSVLDLGEEGPCDRA